MSLGRSGAVAVARERWSPRGVCALFRAEEDTLCAGRRCRILSERMQSMVRLAPLSG
jgi:hypothetical protein